MRRAPRKRPRPTRPRGCAPRSARSAANRRPRLPAPDAERLQFRAGSQCGPALLVYGDLEMATTAITADQVKQLRDKTGAGMMECKAALAEANGNIEEAI